MPFCDTTSKIKRKSLQKCSDVFVKVNKNVQLSFLYLITVDSNVVKSEKEMSVSADWQTSVTDAAWITEVLVDCDVCWLHISWYSKLKLLF